MSFLSLIFNFGERKCFFFINYWYLVNFHINNIILNIFWKNQHYIVCKMNVSQNKKPHIFYDVYYLLFYYCFLRSFTAFYPY